MSLLKVKYMGASVLKRPAKKISTINKEILNLAEDMLETMYKYNGVGLAAPQIGVSKQMIVVDCGDKYQKEPIVLINPVIVEHKGLQLGDEGCLSLPGLYLPVLRADYIAVESMDFSGKKVVYEGKELLSRCFQHEIDHLNGKLFIEMVEDKNAVEQGVIELKERIDKILRGELPVFQDEEDELLEEETEKEEVNV